MPSDAATDGVNAVGGVGSGRPVSAGPGPGVDHLQTGLQQTVQPGG